MTEAERDLLMPFLRKLVQTKNNPGDEAANTLIHTALVRQPNASYLLVQRALTLECELATALRRICELEGRPLPEERVQPAADFLDPVTSGWGEGVERKRTVTTSKKLYDFFKETQAKKADDLESRAIIFIGKHSGKIWLSILALATVVVQFRDRFV